jgi:predicted transcriptional regulator/FtsZ-binding cell division protein ZapB
MNMQAEKLKEENSLLRKEIDSHKIMIDSLNRKIKVLESENEALKTKLEVSENEYDAGQYTRDQLIKDRDQLQAVVQELVEKLKSTTDEKEKYKSKLQGTAQFNEPAKRIEIRNELWQMLRERLNAPFYSIEVPERLAMLLQNLYAKESLTTNQIMEEYQISRSTVQQNLSYIIKTGLIKLKAGKRKAAFVITDEGKEFLEKIYFR